LGNPIAYLGKIALEVLLKVLQGNNCL